MNKRNILIPSLLLFGIFIVGTFGYEFTEGIKLSDAAWLAAVSILTIGYGDIAPVTPQGKIFTLIIIPIAIALVTYILAQFAGSVVGGKFAREVKQLTAFEADI